MNVSQQSREPALIRSIAANPRELQNYFSLAELYQAAGESRKAELTFRRIIEIDPMCLRAWVNLGTLLGLREDWRNSADAFERACALDPRDASNRIRYGAALLSNRDIGPAMQTRDVLLTQFPDRAEGHVLAGHLHKIYGRREAATAAYARAIDIDPAQTDALYNLVDLSPPPVSDPLTQHLEALRTGATLASRESANILFSLARIHEHSGRIGSAMAFYDEANAAAERAMRELGIVYDPARMEADTNRMIELFDSGAIAEPLEPLELDMTLVFIVGMPRSGTTLVERILASHSAVVAGGELPFMQDCLAQLLASEAAQKVEGALRPRDEHTRAMLLHLRELYLDNLFERDLDACYVTDKLPANFAAIGLIRILFPDARIIHCSRDPLATCWSLYSAHFGAHLPYNATLQSLGHYHRRIYSALMHHWHNVSNLDLIEVDYDKLVTDPDGEMRELIRRCGLPWEDACLRFHENDAPVFTANMLQVRQPVSSASTTRWRKFQQYLSPLMTELGKGHRTVS